MHLPAAHLKDAVIILYDKNMFFNIYAFCIPARRLFPCDCIFAKMPIQIPPLLYLPTWMQVTLLNR